MPSFRGTIECGQLFAKVIVVKKCIDPLNNEERKSHCTMLIDTGATKTVISSRVIQGLHLIPKTKAEMHSASHTSSHLA